MGNQTNKIFPILLKENINDYLYLHFLLLVVFVLRSAIPLLTPCTCLPHVVSTYLLGPWYFRPSLLCLVFCPSLLCRAFLTRRLYTASAEPMAKSKNASTWNISVGQIGFRVIFWNILMLLLQFLCLLWLSCKTLSAIKCAHFAFIKLRKSAPMFPLKNPLKSYLRKKISPSYLCKISPSYLRKKSSP